jgi:cyclopropane-fatty-acyl-phospholipid synthase
LKASDLNSEVAFQAPSGTLTKFAKKMVLRSLEGLTVGCLQIEDAEGRYLFGDPADSRYPMAKILIKDPGVYMDMMLGGSMGAAEAFMRDEWQTEDLTAVIRVFSANMEMLNRGIDRGLARLSRQILKGLHWMRKNTKSGSKRNIAAHYDLGNDFFKLFLDETMMYSSGTYPSIDASLYEASVNKLDRICKKLDLGPDDHVVEIGTGWGGFAIHAAKNYGCEVTTTTISQEQFNYAKERISAEGLSDRIHLLFSDYRELEGKYDKLVSIEMIEAVGHHYFDQYFETCSRLLKPEGMMLIQAIVMPEDRYLSARDSVDFIKRYIFPGCCIPSLGSMLEAISKKTDLRVFNVEDQTPHYTMTLRDWWLNLKAHQDQALEQGYSNEFLRMWQYYLCYCEGGFAERVIQSMQLVFTKPFNRAEPLMLKL